MVLPWSSKNAEAGPSRPNRRAAAPSTSSPVPPSPSSSLLSTRTSRSRAPASLGTLHRTPRKASTPSLSLVFAGDPTLTLPHTDSPTDIAADPKGKGRGPGSLASGAEDALSRQLIRDSGGQRMGMGLRSRTGSEATVGSMGSDVGRAEGRQRRVGREGREGQAGSNEVGGQDRNGHDPPPANTLHPTISRASHHTARTSSTLGISTTPTAQSAQSGDSGSIRTINPKKSNSWLRWNAPGPQFPRSRAGSVIVPESETERGKGRGAGDGAAGVREGEEKEKGKGKGKTVRDQQDGQNREGVSTAQGSDAGQISGTRCETANPEGAAPRVGPANSKEVLGAHYQRPPGPSTSEDNADNTAHHSDGATKTTSTKTTGRHSSPPNSTPAAVITDWTPTVKRTGWQAWIWGSGVPIPDGQAGDADETKADGTFDAAGPGVRLEAGGPADVQGSASTHLIGREGDSESMLGQLAEPAAAAAASPEQPKAQTSAQTKTTRDASGRANGHANNDNVAGKGLTSPTGISTTAYPANIVTDTVRTGSVANADTNSDSRPAPAAQYPPRQGWGGYLYSYVSRTPSAPAALPTSGTAAELISDGPADSDIGAMTADRQAGPVSTKPERSSAVAVAEPATASAPPMGKPSTADRTDQPSNSPKSATDSTIAPNIEGESTPDPTASTVQPSTPQPQGWLFFLARRAAQRTIKPVSSSLDGRLALEAGANVGETMDFSDDPDFPSARVPEEGNGVGVPSNAGQAGAPAAAKDAVSNGPSYTTATGTLGPQGGVVIRNKRLSISSGRSIGASPLSTSPRSNTHGLVNGAPSGNATKPSGKTTEPAHPDARPALSATTGPSSLTASNGTAKAQASPASSVRSMPAAVPSSNPAVAASPPRPTSTSKLPSTSTSTSAIPHLPLRAPNVITPSFDDTFNRPPRSLLPLDEEIRLQAGGAGSAGGEGGGAAGGSGTMGKLAWRAWGTASYYMYGATSDPPAPSSPSLKSHSTANADSHDGPAGGNITDAGGKGETKSTRDTRGLGAARTVGSSLPRLLGIHPSPSSVELSTSGYAHVRRVVVIGVHGWFPAKMLNSVIGEPTGTSVKFASMMAGAVRAFFDEVDGQDDGDGEGEGAGDGEGKGDRKGDGKGKRELRITEIPLEGEGTIEHRVDRLYKAYLSNPAWINDLRRADAIFFAAHSQGCIVTTHLISRMIAQGHIRTAYNADAVARCEWAFGPIGVVPSPPSATFRVPSDGKTAGDGKQRTSGGASAKATGHSQPHPANPNDNIPGSEGGYQKVCLLDMCGVHLGPLYSISTSSVIQPYLQWFENAAARELFEFQDSGSVVSKEYAKALEMVLEHGVKVVLLASLNDQVVPIYGASFSTASHPLLLRALFVDGASYSSSDFMIKLLNFAFMLRNAGLDDQRLVEHLSEATAGSLTGLGHSTPYEEPASYALAVSYLFRTGPASSTLSPLQIEPFSARDARNDYELPWIMRALVDSPEVQDLFSRELAELKEGVVGWKPVTKVLKEVKKRLEPMAGRQSKLRNSITATAPGMPGSGTPDGQGGANGLPAAGLKRDW